jgi:hypothetical protein
MLGAHLLGLLNVSQASLELVTGGWWQQQTSCFLNITWQGKAFYALGVQAVKVLILLDALFPPSVAPASQQGF